MTLLWLLVASGAQDARAIVVTRANWLNAGPLPSNGVLLLHVPRSTVAPPDQPQPAVEVVMTGAAGLIEGTIEPFTGAEEFVIFRPSAEVPPGSYTLSITPSQIRAAYEVEVVEAVADPEPRGLDIALTLAVAQQPGGETACCEDNPDLDGPFEVQPACPNIEVIDYQVLSFALSSPLGAAAALQHVHRLARAPENGPGWPSGFVSIGWASLPAYAHRLNRSGVPSDLDRFCVRFESINLMTGELYETESCIDNPHPELLTQPRTDYAPVNGKNGLGIDDCPKPPPGLEREWCDLNQNRCTWLRNSSALSCESTLLKCAPFYALCDTPASMPTDCAEPIAGNAARASDAGERDDAGTSPRSRSPASAGCAIGPSPSGSTGIGWPLVALLAIGRQRKILR